MHVHLLQVVDGKYDGVATKVGPDQEIAFEEEQITLDIPKGGVMLESGWSIIPCTHPMVSSYHCLVVHLKYSTLCV